MNESGTRRTSSGSPLDRAWRVVGTGLSFALFGLGALVLGFTVWPLLRLSSRDRRIGIARVQRAVSRSMRLFVWFMETFGIVSHEVHGVEKLRAPGQFVVANHPTILDVVFLVALMPEVDCIVKQALWRNVFLRWPVYWAGYISNETGDGLIAACATALREGRSLMVFPEGTRTLPGQPMKLQRGAAQIALAAKVDLRPVTITCHPISLYKGTPWFRVPRHRSHWVLSVDDPISVDQFLTAGEPPSLAARRLTEALRQWFEMRRGTPQPS